MSHHHDSHHGDHHHHQHGDRDSSLSSRQKLVKRLEHWIAHNDEHAETYREWAKTATEMGMSPVSELLEEAAQATAAINHTLQDAIGRIAPE